MDKTFLTESGYQRVITTKFAGKCRFCLTDTVPGQDFAARSRKGEWHAICAKCAASPAGMAAGLVARIQAADTGSTDVTLSDDTVALLPDVLAGTTDNATGIRVIVDLWKVAKAVEAATHVDDPRIVALRNITPKGSFESSFIPSVLDQYAKRGSLSPRQWATIDKVLDRAANGGSDERQALPDLDNGLYLLDGASVWRLYTTQNGRQGARCLNTERQTFDYVRGGVRSVRQAVANGNGRLLTGPEAAAMGRQHEFCVVCARDLSDDVSIAMGIGPVCSANLGMPRISEDDAHRILRGEADAADVIAGLATA